MYYVGIAEVPHVIGIAAHLGDVLRVLLRAIRTTLRRASSGAPTDDVVALPEP